MYFTDFRTKPNVSLTEKLQKLCRRAGIAEIPFEEKFTAIKMHFGELGNLAFLRPNYAKAVADLVKELGGKPCFHISLIMDVSPNCDCHSENDAPILPDIGMLASFDPVALDQACADLCIAAEPIRNSQLGDHLAQPDWHHHHDPFQDNHPNTSWRETLAHAEKIGLGTREYELIRI